VAIVRLSTLTTHAQIAGDFDLSEGSVTNDCERVWGAMLACYWDRRAHAAGRFREAVARFLDEASRAWLHWHHRLFSPEHFVAMALQLVLLRRGQHLLQLQKRCLCPLASCC
jgi:hypothetical protein